MKFQDYIQPKYPLVFSSAYPDLQTAHVYADEFYRVHCPVLVYKEIDRDNSAPHEDLAAMWGEQVGGLKIGRKINIHSFPDYDTEEKQIHKKHATEVERAIRFAFGLLELQRCDVYPEMGDHIEFAGYEYEIMKVYVLAMDIWQQTNQPMHVSADAIIYRPGDSKHSQHDKKRI